MFSTLRCSLQISLVATNYCCPIGDLAAKLQECSLTSCYANVYPTRVTPQTRLIYNPPYGLLMGGVLVGLRLNHMRCSLQLHGSRWAPTSDHVVAIDGGFDLEEAAL